jgi:hypothetical protein
MPSTYTTNGGIELPANGEQSGTWGSTVNDNMNIIDRLTNGVGVISLSGTTHTLTTADGTPSDGHYNVLVLGGSPSGTNTITITPNDGQHVYIVKNISGQTATFTQGSGASISVLNNTTKIIYADGAGAGAAVVDITAAVDLGALIIGGTTVTSSAAELNILDGVTATAAELNILDGVTATTTEINYVDGVTSDIQTQINAKGTVSTLSDLGVTASAAELNYNDITTLGTVQASKTVTADASGDVRFLDSGKAIFGTGSDLQIYHDGSNSIIRDNGTGSLFLEGDTVVIRNTASNETMAQFVQDGAVTLYYDNAAKLATASGGVSVTGTVTVTGTVAATSYTGSGAALTGVIPTTYGAVGTYVWGHTYNQYVYEGTTYAGSTIAPASVHGYNGNLPADVTADTIHIILGVMRGATYLSGTWRGMGRAVIAPIGNFQQTLFVRIS